MSKLPWKPITIYDGDDQQRLRELEADVEAAIQMAAVAKTGNSRVGDAVSPAAALDAMQAFIAEAEGRAEQVHVHAIGSVDFRELRQEHPPRKITETVDGKAVEDVHPDDGEPFHVNTKTFPLALLMFVDKEDPEVRTISKPALDGPALKKFLQKEITAGQFDQAWATAFFLNDNQASDPKAWHASASRLASAKSID